MPVVARALLLARASRLSWPSWLSWRLAAAVALVGCAGAVPAQAAFLYTFTFDALAGGAGGPAFAAGTIVFSSDAIAVEGDSIFRVGGNVNDCAPNRFDYGPGASPGTRGGFEMPFFSFCGDGNGPQVDGLFFRPDTDPNGVGVFSTAANAGRFFIDEMGGSFRYTSGTLTITDLDANGVPEPGTLALVGLSLFGLFGQFSMSGRGCRTA